MLPWQRYAKKRDGSYRRRLISVDRLVGRRNWRGGVRWDVVQRSSLVVGIIDISRGSTVRYRSANMTSSMVFAPNSNESV
jgi:hypothetical protein